MNEEIRIVTYCQVLQELESTSQCSHLLLGNGFNASLGIATDYESIFERMIEENFIYREIKQEIENQGYNIEELIDKLEQCLKEKGSISNFLKRYMENKVKFDFMKAASSIVRERIKGIYHDNNEKIHLLFKNFSSYFTLNYDTFLYLLLMKFKKSELDSSKVVAFQKSHLFRQQDLNEVQNEIYRAIKEARHNGKITAQINDQTLSVDLRISKKVFFQNVIEIYKNKANKNWTNKDIKKVCDQIWEEEANNNNKLEHINDGFQGSLFKCNEDQNIFFLHGSFHIYKNRECIRKITQTQDKAVYENLEETIQTSSKDVICVFTSKSEDKVNQIENDRYLERCLNKLSKLSGIIVILGSSLADNDSHIFSAINRSQINKIYISSSLSKKSKNLNKARKFFPDKEIILFDRETISYNLSIDKDT